MVPEKGVSKAWKQGVWIYGVRGAKDARQETKAGGALKGAEVQSP